MTNLKSQQEIKGNPNFFSGLYKTNSSRAIGQGGSSKLITVVSDFSSFFYQNKWGHNIVPMGGPRHPTPSTPQPSPPHTNIHRKY